jgi:REP element-mobilizing transposase RayT
VARLPIFRNADDYLKFLSVLASVADRDGLACHSYALMPNHYHLALEDPRGNLSRSMQSIGTTYGRYFNDVRGMRGNGHVFAGRFWSAGIHKASYYDKLSAYILLNPVRCDPPLAASAEHYPWSSAKLHLSNGTPGEYFAQLVERHGGVESLLSRWPRPSKKRYGLKWKQQIQTLIEGNWIDRDATRCLRSPAQMRQMLEERRGMGKPKQSEPEPGPIGSRKKKQKPKLAPTSVTQKIQTPPRVTQPFKGHRILSVKDLVTDACKAVVPQDSRERLAVHCYALWRFTSASKHQIGKALKVSTEKVDAAIRTVRWLREDRPPWAPLLWRLEWKLGRQLGASPWRA